MARLGYAAFSVHHFVGFQTDLSQGAWAAIDDTASRGHATIDMSTGAYFKRVLRAAIDGAVAAQRADNDVQRADAPWDDAERRFVLTVSVKALDDDPAVRADALKVQSQLCPEGKTTMTGLEAGEEVDYARNQLRLSRERDLAPVVQKLGLRPMLDEIERRTDDLDSALRKGDAAVSRSRRIAAAQRRCVAAFNHVHEGLAMLASVEIRPKERATLDALIEPFNRMLDRRPDAPVADENDGTGDEKPTDTPVTPVIRVA